MIGSAWGSFPGTIRSLDQNKPKQRRKTMQDNYIMRQDPGHGWLEVERSELSRLGIGNKISGYSYQNNGKIYLEEDCDAGCFIQAKKAADESIKITEVYEDPTKIRDYQPYSAA